MTGAVETAHRILDLLAAEDVDAALALVADDVVVREAPSLPYGGDHHGKEGFVGLFHKIGATWADFGFEVHDIFGTDECVTLVETISGRVGDRRFVLPIVEIWRFRDGKLAEATPYYHDTHQLVALVAEAGVGA